MPGLEKKFMTFEFKVTKAEDNNGIGHIEGYASTFGNVDQGYDVVDRGAFAKTINDKKGKFPILLDHDPSKPIGWNIEASEDEYGLKIKGEIQLITEEAKNRYALAKRAQELGTKMGLSIGYSTIKWENDHENEAIRHLKELKLWEYSLVTFPMNVEAGVTAVKRIFDRLQTSGYDELKIEAALKKLLDDQKDSAAEKVTDPALLQSVDNLIQKLRAR